MDKYTEKELDRVNKRVDDVEEAQAEDHKTIVQLAKDMSKFWHIGLGAALGYLVHTMGLEKIISRFL